MSFGFPNQMRLGTSLPLGERSDIPSTAADDLAVLSLTFAVSSRVFATNHTNSRQPIHFLFVPIRAFRSRKSTRRAFRSHSRMKKCDSRSSLALRDCGFRCTFFWHSMPAIFACAHRL